MAGKQLYDRAKLVPIICDRLAKGEPLAAICRDLGVNRRTVNLWRKEDASIDEQIQDARDDGYDYLAKECLDIADNTEEGEVIVEKGGKQEVQRGDMLGHRKLKIDTRLKLLAKWDPKRYGDKQQLEHTGPNGGPVQAVNMSNEEFAQIAAMVASEV